MGWGNQRVPRVLVDDVADVDDDVVVVVVFLRMMVGRLPPPLFVVWCGISFPSLYSLEKVVVGFRRRVDIIAKGVSTCRRRIMLLSYIPHTNYISHLNFIPISVCRLLDYWGPCAVPWNPPLFVGRVTLSGKLVYILALKR